MKSYTLQCTYCGHIWNRKTFLNLEKSHLKCEKCQDKNVTLKKAEYGNYFGYEEDETEDNDIDLDMYDDSDV